MTACRSERGAKDTREEALGEVQGTVLCMRPDEMLRMVLYGCQIYNPFCRPAGIIY